MLNIDICRLKVTYLILYLLKHISGLSSNDDIINLSGFTSNNVTVTKTTDAIIIDVYGLTKNLDK